MAYVNFKNSPSEETPLTGGASGTLNVMQENGITHGSDTKLGYSQVFLNDHLVNVSNEVDEDYRVNLLETKNLLGTSLELGTFTNSGVKDTSTTNYRTANMVKVKPNTTYTTSINGTAQAYAVYFYTAGGVHISSATAATFTTPANCEYLNFRCFNADFTNDFATLKVQLEEGSTATAYEAFIQNQIVVDNEKYTDTLNVGTNVDSRSRVNVLKGKNVFNMGLFTFRQKGSSPYYQSFYLESFSTNQIDVRCGGGSYVEAFIDAKNLKPNTKYVISWTITRNDTSFTPTLNLASSGITDANGNLTINVNLNNGGTSSNNTHHVIFSNIQLEEGSSATSYEPYITPSIYVDNEEIYSKGVVLYDGGTTGSDLSSPISFSDSLANYERIEIYYGTSRPYYISSFYSNYGQHQYFEPSLQFYYLNNADSAVYIYVTLLTISQSAMELHSSRGSRTITIASNGSITNTKSTTSSSIKIYKVIGYK